MTDFVAATRASYDALSDGYQEWIDTLGGLNPLDRVMYDAFAELVGPGPVADVGCGTGWGTDLLRGLGLDVFGVDLSPGMIDVARRTYPDLRFEVGSMLDLDVPDATLAGLVAAHSIIHVPWDQRPAVFAEFHRVLAAGGQLLLSFQVGDERRHATEIWGRPIDLTWYRQRPAEVTALLRDAGFDVRAEIVRRPEPNEKSPHARVFAVKPA